MPIKSILIPGFLFTAFCLLACAIKVDEEKLELLYFPDSIGVGDTTNVINATKIARDAQGRIQTTPNYTNFTLHSDDTASAAIVLNRRVLGLSPDTVGITAWDDAPNSTISSGKYQLIVAP